MGIRRVTNPAKVIAAIYNEGRTFPRGGKPVAARSYDLPGYEPPRDELGVQHAEAGPLDPNFNDAKRDWKLGYGKPHPAFDAGGSGRRYK